MYKVIFMGTPDIALAPLKEIIENKNFNLVGVVTQPDKPFGRERKIKSSEVKSYLNEKNIEVKLFQPEKIASIYEELKILEPDLIITCAYGQFLNNDILNITKIPPLNIHASLLPKYRGGAPIHYAVINGETKSGISIMKMTDKMDAGEVYKRLECSIDESDTMGDLYLKLKHLAGESVFEIVKIIDNGFKGKPQNESEATVAPNIKYKDKKINFNDESFVVYNHIRGLSPHPIAFTKLKNKTVKIYSAENNIMNGDPGTVIAIKDGIIIACKNGSILVKELQIEGKSKQLWKDVINGNQIKLGDIFN